MKRKVFWDEPQRARKSLPRLTSSWNVKGAIHGRYTRPKTLKLLLISSYVASFERYRISSLIVSLVIATANGCLYFTFYHRNLCEVKKTLYLPNRQVPWKNHWILCEFSCNRLGILLLYLEIDWNIEILLFINNSVNRVTYLVTASFFPWKYKYVK